MESTGARNEISGRFRPVAGPASAGPATGRGTVRLFLCAALPNIALVAALAAAFAPTATAIGSAVMLYLAITLLAARGLAAHHGHGRVGGANIVTQFRAALTASLVAPLADALGGGGATTGWMVPVMGSICLLLDGVDGLLARRQGLASAFGARFDMEIDCLLALLLSLLAFWHGSVGPAVLLLGSARYVFIAASFLWPWLLGPLPPRYSRKVACVVQVASLIAIAVPGLPGAPALVVFALAMLGWSFAVDIAWLARHRKTPTFSS